MRKTASRAGPYQSGTKLAQSMTQTDIRESGKRGSPENQPRAGAARSPEADTLTSSGIASLLKSEFAAQDKPEESPGNDEVPPGEEAGSTDDAGAAEATAENAEHAEATAGTEQTEQGQLPQELQAAIEQWEEQGGGELPQVLQELVNRRIGKLTGEREEHRTARETAEARVRELEQQVEQLQASPERTVAAPAGPTDPKALDKLEKTTRGFLSDAENFLDGTATEEEQGRIERYMQENRLDEKGLKRMVREVSMFLTTDLPEQKRAAQSFRQAEAQAEPMAKKYFPWLYDKAAPEYARAQEVLQTMPDLPSRTPLHKLITGVYVLGLKEFDRLRAGGNGKGQMANGKARPPARTPATGAAPPKPRASAGPAEEEDARRQFNERPTAQNVEKLLKLGLR